MKKTPEMKKKSCGMHCGISHSACAINLLLVGHCIQYVKYLRADALTFANVLPLRPCQHPDLTEGSALDPMS